jgi:hypothetical protein
MTAISILRVEWTRRETEPILLIHDFAASVVFAFFYLDLKIKYYHNC